MKNTYDLNRIVIVEDDPDFASVIKECLEEEEDFSVVQIINNEEDALKFIHSPDLQSVDCVLLDLRIPRSQSDRTTSGSAGLRLLAEARNRMHYFGTIIVLTSSRDPEDGQKALAAGCDGYLCKAAPVDQLPLIIEELKIAIRGHIMVIAKELRHVFFRTDVSVREAQLMDLLANGKGWPEIANALSYSSPKAAANIGDRVFDKLLTEDDKREIETQGLKKKAKALAIWRLRQGQKAALA